VDEKLQSKGVLNDGDRKYLHTDHVKLRPGTADEVAIVRWIFQEFLQRKSETAIAHQLNREAIPTSTGQPWNRALIGRLLRNENYIGNVVFNRRSYKLREKRTYNQPDVWIRSENCIEPIIERTVFLRARKIIEERRVDLPEGEMLARLRRTLIKERRLSPAIIDRTLGLPCTATYRQHFGSLRNVYRLIGYTSKRDCDYIDSKQVWDDLIAKCVSEMGAAIENAGGRAALTDSIDCLRVNGTVSISFRIARWCAGKKKHHSPYWGIRRQVCLPPGWLVAIRLAEGNKGVLDFLFLPTAEMIGSVMKLSERNRVRRGFHRFENFDALVRSVSRVTKPSRASPAKPAQRTKQSRSSQSKTTSGRARH
jgi:hypothetical protein